MKHLQLTAAVIYSYFASVIESLALFCIALKQKGAEGKERADHFLEFDFFIKSLYKVLSYWSELSGWPCDRSRGSYTPHNAFNYDAVSSASEKRKWIKGYTGKSK